MAPPVAWQTHPPQRSPEVPVKGLRARPEGRPGHGRLGVAHTEVTGFTCRGAGRSPSGMPCLPRQRFKGFESRSEQDDSYFCGSICDAEREAMKSLPERIMEHAEATPRPRRRPRRSARRPCFTSAKRAAVGQALSRLARSGRLMRIRQGVYMRPIESRFGRCAPGIEKSPQALSELWGETIVPNGGGAANWLVDAPAGHLPG